MRTADNTPPAFVVHPARTRMGPTFFDLLANIDEAGRVFFVVLKGSQVRAP